MNTFTRVCAQRGGELLDQLPHDLLAERVEAIDHQRLDRQIELGRKKKKGPLIERPFDLNPELADYIMSMPPMPPMPPCGMCICSSFFFGDSATPASVVTRRPATEAASCSAVRTTLAGSMMPFWIRSPYSLFWA